MILRRLGKVPHFKGRTSPGCDGCPDLFELNTGEFAVIGRTATEEIRPHLPESAGCGNDETIVVVPRYLFVEAKNDIPDQE